jgi:PRTRC genetic system protein C
MVGAVDILKREFVIGTGSKTTSLPDPNPDFSPEEVLKHYIALHPELSNASIAGPDISNKKLTYQFRTSVGTKG